MTIGEPLRRDDRSDRALLLQLVSDVATLVGEQRHTNAHLATMNGTLGEHGQRLDLLEDRHQREDGAQQERGRLLRLGASAARGVPWAGAAAGLMGLWQWFVNGSGK